MLFRDQMETVVKDGESLYFAGASLQTVNDANQIMHISAVKQEDGNIRTTVSHLSMDPKDLYTDEVVFEKTFDPVTFERFINDMAMTIPQEKITNRLIELTYKARGITHPDGERMTDAMKGLLHKLFLISSTVNRDAGKGYAHIDELLKTVNAGTSPAILENAVAKMFTRA